MSDLASLQYQSMLVRESVRANLQGLSHEESLVPPSPAGNSANWIFGHLVAVYNDALPLFGQERVVPAEHLARYARGSKPITAADAMRMDALRTVWDDACARVDAGLASFPLETLGAKAPFSPSGNPDETVGSLMATVVFHQAYHAGQLGVLRRMAGKDGALG